MPLFIQPKIQLASFAALAYSLPMSHLLPTTTLGAFSTELIPSQSVPSPSCWQGLLLPGAGLCICPCWVSYGSYQPIPSTCLGLNSSPALEHISCSPSSGVSCKPDEQALHHLIHIVGKKVRYEGSQDRPLCYCMSYWCPSRVQPSSGFDHPNIFFTHLIVHPSTL